MPGSLILYLKGMRTTMFQLSGFYCNLKLKTLKSFMPALPAFDTEAFEEAEGFSRTCSE